MAQLEIRDDGVHIELSTMDKIWAVQGSLTIPLAHITGAHVENENGWAYLWRKVIGTTAPGLKMAGTFFGNDGLAFLDFGSGSNCVVLDTEHEFYKHVIVEVSGDPVALAAELNQRIGTTHSS